MTRVQKIHALFRNVIFLYIILYFKKSHKNVSLKTTFLHEKPTELQSCADMPFENGIKHPILLQYLEICFAFSFLLSHVLILML